jgi:hypothetical protein
MTLTEAKDALMRVYARGKRAKNEYKQDLQEIGHRGIIQLTAIGTGAAVGAVRGMWGNPTTGDVEIPGIGVDVDIAAGVLVSAPALFGMFGDVSDVVNTVGATLNGIVVAREMERLVKAQVAK